MSYLGRGLEQVDNISKLDNITFNGGTTYALTKDSAAFTPISSNAILISIDGVIQQGNFSVSGTNIVFNFSPTGSNTCDFILHYGTGVAFTPADNSITKDKTNFVSTSSSSGLQIKGDGTTDGTLQLNCSQNSHGVKIKSPAHSAGQSYTLTLPTTAPASNKMLQTDGSGNLSFVDKPSGKFNVVRSAAFSSGDSYMEITNAFNSTYRNYLVKMEQLKPSDDGADLRVEFGQSDGTYSAAANFGARMYMFNGNLHNYGGTNATGFTPTWSMDNGAWHNVEMFVYDPMSTTDGKHQYSFLSESKRYDQEYGAVFGGGMYGVAAALPRLKVRVNNGTFSEGRITVYGITNTGNV
jgi:hypothetical protein